MKKESYTKALVIKGVDQDGAEIQINAVLDKEKKVSFLETAGKFRLVKTMIVHEQSDVTVEENITTTEVSPVDKTWEDYVWQIVKSDQSAYYIIQENDAKNGFNIFVKNESFPDIAGPIALKGVLIAGQTFLAPQNTLEFNVTNANDAGGNRYSMNHAEMFALSNLIREKQATQESKSKVLAYKIHFTRS